MDRIMIRSAVNAKVFLRQGDNGTSDAGLRFFMSLFFLFLVLVII
jgi:hypothetical protein